MNKFWRWVRNEAEAQQEGQPAQRTLYLEGVLSENSWFDDDITPAAFKEELLQDTGPVTVAINSPGGDCVAASMIYTALMEYPGKVTVRIEGIAASAASVVAMAGEVIQMSPTALLMIHNPSTIAMGESSDMDKAIRLLDETKESIINAYHIKTGLSRAKLSHMMDDETWLNALKAKELGFCDEILYTEEQPRQTEEKPSFIFSQREANLMLVNLVREKNHEEEQTEEEAVPGDPPPPEDPPEDRVPEAPAQQEEKPAEPVPEKAENTPAPETRVKAADLKKRLSLLSY